MYMFESNHPEEPHAPSALCVCGSICVELHTHTHTHLGVWNVAASQTHNSNYLRSHKHQLVRKVQLGGGRVTPGYVSSL